MNVTTLRSLAMALVAACCGVGAFHFGDELSRNAGVDPHAMHQIAEGHGGGNGVFGHGDGNGVIDRVAAHEGGHGRHGTETGHGVVGDAGNGGGTRRG